MSREQPSIQQRLNTFIADLKRIAGVSQQDTHIKALNKLNRYRAHFFGQSHLPVYHAAHALLMLQDQKWHVTALKEHIHTLEKGPPELVTIFADFRNYFPIEGSARCGESEASRWLRLQIAQQEEFYQQTNPTALFTLGN
jgi:hypothetical protein